jgi:molybdopterin-containing oxidoreductase family membrane subunit
VGRQLTYGVVTKDVLRPLFKPSTFYLAGIAVVLCMLAIGGYCWYQQLTWGLGVAGYTPPVFWGVYITTFVFWIGIGHAGTLISAILFLFRSRGARVCTARRKP